MLLYMPRARKQSFYSVGFSCFRFQYNGLRYDPALLQLLGYFATSEAKRFARHGRAVVNDSILPTSNTRREKLLREF